VFAVHARRHAVGRTARVDAENSRGDA